MWLALRPLPGARPGDEFRQGRHMPLAKLWAKHGWIIDVPAEHFDEAAKIVRGGGKLPDTWAPKEKSVLPVLDGDIELPPEPTPYEAPPGPYETLTEMTKADLLELAANRGLNLDPHLKKSDLIKAILQSVR